MPIFICELSGRYLVMVGVDADKRHQRRTHDGQDEHDNKQELAFFDDESCDLLHGLRNSFRARRQVSQR